MRRSTICDPRSVRSSPLPLVGRKSEMGVLRAMLEAATRGEGGLVLLRGPAGSGKTRLLELLAGWATEANMPVYRGAAWDSSEAPPLWPWREVVRAAIEGNEPSELVGDLAPALLALAGLSRADDGPLTPQDVRAARLDRFTDRKSTRLNSSH